MLNYSKVVESSGDEMVLVYGQFQMHFAKFSKIRLKHGFLHLNKPMRKKEPFCGMIEMAENAHINVTGHFSIHTGSNIILMKNAVLNLGSGYINRNAKIRCFEEITIGENVAISEDVTIWDTDAHTIIGKEAEMTKPIKIGDHVWIGNNVTILKGVTIGDGAIIAAGSVVTRNIPEKCLAAGVPAKVIKENVDWN